VPNPFTWVRALAHIQRTWDLEKTHGEILEAQANEIQALKDRGTRLEAREEMLIVKAQAAAGAAATAALAELAVQIGALDERTKRLPPP
jgi:hypothetical protein